ncbi:Uncharacterised protein [uncultured archaeon]|nr:Uncharacterised protein [uncultured archaeon]
MLTQSAFKVTKETDDAFFYEFPLNGNYYIIRWLGSGGYHLYPPSDGKLPEGFSSLDYLQFHLKDSFLWRNWKLGEDYIVVSCIEASKYPVPKRW